MHYSDLLLTNYKKLIETSPDILYQLTLKGRITFLSPSFEKITGWKRKEWIGKSFTNIIQKEDIPTAVLIFKNALEGKMSSYEEIRIKSKERKTIIVGSFMTYPEIKNKKVVGVVGIARDITKWKKEGEHSRRYANLIESSDSAIYTRDIRGRVMTWNRAAEELFGYTADEIIGKNVSMMLPEEYKNKVTIINKKLSKNDFVSDFEIELIKKSGEKIPVTAKISPIRDKSEKLTGAAIFARDNTQKLKEEKAESLLADATGTLASSFQYEKTLCNVGKLLVPRLADWSAIHILERGEAVRVSVNHVNPHMIRAVQDLEKKYGYSRNANSRVKVVLKTGKSELYPFVTDEILKEKVEEKKEWELIRLLQLKSFMIVPMFSRKKILGTITLVSSDSNRLYDKKDLKLAEELGRRAGQAIENAKLFYEAKKELAKRRRAEKALRQSRDELEVILRSIADGITVQDTQGNLTYANEAAVVSSGYSSSRDMIKDPVNWEKVYRLETESGEKLAMKDLPGRKALLEKREFQMVVAFVHKKSRRRRWAIVKARPILDPNGEVKAVVNIVNDITDRQELERRKDDFISIASHELKTPLTSVKGFVYVLKKSLQKNSEAILMLNKVDIQVSRLSSLVQDLLDLSRMRDGKLTYHHEKFELSSLIGDVVSDMQQTNPKHIIQLKNGVKVQVMGDKDRISQVIINLLTNAIKYSPQNNKIKVAVGKDKKKAHIKVMDKGIGISSHEYNKIFERFYRVNDSKGKTFPGHGVGLFFSKEVIKRHKGRIWVESKMGKGSTFHVTLPLRS